MQDERMALRQTDDGLLDDVVVQQVSMFRAEMIDSDHLWLCFYLPDTGVANDRIAFAVTAIDGDVRFEVVEMPDGQVSVEPPSP